MELPPSDCCRLQCSCICWHCVPNKCLYHHHLIIIITAYCIQTVWESVTHNFSVLFSIMWSYCLHIYIYCTQNYLMLKHYRNRKWIYLYFLLLQLFVCSPNVTFFTFSQKQRTFYQSLTNFIGTIQCWNVCLNQINQSLILFMKCVFVILILC